MSRMTADEKRKLRADLVLALVVIAVSLILLALLYQRQDGQRVVILIDGKATAEYDLSVNRTVTIKTADGGENILAIQDGSCYMKEANCPDHICVREGHSHRKGQSIICLPHHLVVQIEGGKENGVDAVAR